LPQHSAPFTIGFPFIELPAVDSTNNYAMALIHEGVAQPGTAVMAHDQTAGKGQRGKQWIAGKNENINLSVIVKPDRLLMVNQFELIATTAIALHQFFANYAGHENTRIKWPNDIYWGDRKAAGILIDNVLSASEIPDTTQWKWSVIGMGVNINTDSFSPQLTQAVSLKQITGVEYEITALAKELCRIMDHHIHRLFDGDPHILERYNQLLYKKDETVKFKIKNRVFEARVKKVNPQGQLLVQHAIEEAFDFGQVEWLF